MQTWPEIWSRRSLPEEGTVLDRLIRADGFDSGAGEMSEELWLKNHQNFCETVGVAEGDSVLEIGCGAGAFLYPFYSKKHRVGGVDYSKALVTIARSVMKEMSFEVSDAASFQKKSSYHIVVSHGVFHYFPDEAYAREVVTKMTGCALKCVAILDVPNAALETESELYRKGALTNEDYESKYSGLGHRYYEKEWFRELAGELGWAARIFDQSANDYGNSAFRFNVVLTR